MMGTFTCSTSHAVSILGFFHINGKADLLKRQFTLESSLSDPRTEAELPSSFLEACGASGCRRQDLCSAFSLSVSPSISSLNAGFRSMTFSPEIVTCHEKKCLPVSSSRTLGFRIHIFLGLSTSPLFQSAFPIFQTEHSQQSR